MFYCSWFKFTLMKYNYFPAKLSQLRCIDFIQFLITIYFLSPPFCACLGYSGILAILMPMPEAAMHEDDGLVFGQDDVGFAGQGFVMQFIPEALSMEISAHEHLRLGVFAFDLTHIVAARSAVVYICHASKAIRKGAIFFR